MKKSEDESWLEGIALREAMKKLNDREKLILTLRFFGRQNPGRGC